METLTFERRLEIYKESLLLIEHDIKKYGSYGCGLCKAITMVRDINEPSAYFNGMPKYYPEIYRFRPHIKIHIYWWEPNKKGDQKRIGVLKRVISEMEVELSKK
jgi:hypothetical protein